MRSTTSLPVQLIGREAALHPVRRLLERARDGHGGALQLCAEPGMGRTALLAVAAAEAEAAGFAVVVVEIGSGERGLPGAGAHRLLGAAVDRLPDPPTAAVELLAAIERGAAGTDLDLAAALLNAVTALAGPRPLLLGVDDAHRLDPASLRALGFLAHRLGGHPVALLATCEDDPVPGGDPDGPDDPASGTDGAEAGPATAEPVGAALPGVPACRLEPLDRLSTLDLVDRLVPVEGLGAALARIGEGNPLALVELAGSLTPDQLTGAVAPPSTLPRHSRLRRRCRAALDRLPAPSAMLLLVAAADDGLDEPTLAAAAREAGLDLADLEPAERIGLVEVAPSGVRFPRPWLRPVVYHEAPLVRRRAAHALLARVRADGPDALRARLHAARSGSDAPGLAAELEQLATGARHPCAADALELAAVLSIDPADTARRQFLAAQRAWSAGDRLRAGRLLAGVPDPRLLSEPLRAGADLLAAELAMTSTPPALARRRLLGAVERVGVDDRDQALAALVRAGDALLWVGDDRRFDAVARQILLLRPHLPDPRAQLLFQQFEGFLALFESRYDDAAKALTEMFRLARTLDEPEVLIRAGSAGLLLGDDLATHQLAGRALELARERRAPALESRALECLAQADLALGRFHEAEESLRAAVRIPVDGGAHGSRAARLAWLAVIPALYGDRAASTRHAERARALAGRAHVGQVETIVDWALGLCDLADGQPAAAADRLIRLTVPSGPGGRLVMEVATAPHLIEAASRSGDRAAAQAALAVFDPWARQTRSPHWLAVAARCRALVATDDDVVEAEFIEAQRLHLAVGSAFQLARTALLHGQHLRRRRRPREARRVLNEAMETFRRWPAPAWARQAEAELRAAGHAVRDTGRAAGTAPPAGELTPQQRQIAELVAAGATNREIAGTLFLSTRTVEYHLRNIFTRLGVRSRVELARRVGRTAS